VVRRGAASLSIEAGPNFVIEELSAFAAAAAWTRLAFIRKRKKYLCFPDFFLFSIGHKHRRRRFTHFNQHMLGLGVAGVGSMPRPSRSGVSANTNAALTDTAPANTMSRGFRPIP